VQDDRARGRDEQRAIGEPVPDRGGRLKLLNMQKRVNELMQITKLYSVFESFTDEAAAVRSFNAKAAAV
jgi:hypothetical protein